MTTENTGSDPNAAYERVQREREAARAELAEVKQALADATAALQDVARRDRLVEHFKAKDGFSGDPYAAAANAIADVTVKGAADDGLAEAADAWHSRMSAAFGASREQPAKAPEPPPSPMAAVRPNPTAPAASSLPDGGPMPIGSDAFKEWARGRSNQEIRTAIEQGRAVFSGKNREAMDTVPGMEIRGRR